MKYEIPEEEAQMVKEDISIAYHPNGVADAIWNVLEKQTAEVQSVIASRLNKLLNQSEILPYTIEELNSRIDESERQMLCGDIMPGEQVHSRVRSFINNL